MISKSLIRNLIANGLQPVIVKNGEKQNDFSRFYYDWCEEQKKNNFLEVEHFTGIKSWTELSNIKYVITENGIIYQNK